MCCAPLRFRAVRGRSLDPNFGNTAASDGGGVYSGKLVGNSLSFAHGTSDGQKTMGVITLVLIVSGFQAPGMVSALVVVLAAGLAIGLGTYSGGWRIMRTMGKGIVEIETPQGAASGAATAATILASAHLGFGLSTTHVATGSIVGSGLGRRGAEVRWSVARRMGVAWLLTLPGAALVGGLAALLSGHGVVGVILLLVLLAVACTAIWLISRRNQITHLNVTDSAEVLVLASAAPDTYPDYLRLGSPKAAKEQAQEAEERRLMKIDWAALGIEAVVAIVATLVFTVLLSTGIRLVSQVTVQANQAHRSVGIRTTGYGLLALAGLVVLFGLYLIVPAFH